MITYKTILAGGSWWREPTKFTKAEQKRIREWRQESYRKTLNAILGDTQEKLCQKQ